MRIHQGKSDCKSALGQNRVVESKPVVEDFRETHHSDFFCSNKPETAARTSSTNGLNTCSEKATNSIELEMTLSQDITYRLKEIRKAPDREPEMTLSQDIACKLKEIRKESDVLIIVDETEEDIQNSIREEGAAQHANRNVKKRRAECDDKVLIIENAIEREIRESILISDEESWMRDSSEDDTDEPDNKPVEILNDSATNTPEMLENRCEEPRIAMVRPNMITENKVCEVLESDEDIIGIEDIERIEDFTKMVNIDERPRKLKATERKAKEVPYDQKDLRQWVKNGKAKIPNIKWKDINRFFCSGDPGEEISKGTFTLKRNDYRSLVGRNYVNDLVIEEYFDIIKERNFVDGLPVIGTTSVFLYKQFDNKSFDEAWKDTKRWNKYDLRQ